MFGPYKPPASLRSASPFCCAKRGGFAAAPPQPRAYPARFARTPFVPERGGSSLHFQRMKGDSPAVALRDGGRGVSVGVVVRLYEPPASLRSASPFCSAKRGGFASPFGPPRSMAGVPPLHFPGHTPLASFAPLSSPKGAFVLRPRSREKGIPGGRFARWRARRFSWGCCAVCMNPLRRCAPRPPFAPQKGEDSPPLRALGHPPLDGVVCAVSIRCRRSVGVREVSGALAALGFQGLLDGLEDAFEVVNDFVVPEAEDAVAVLV